MSCALKMLRREIQTEIKLARQILCWNTTLGGHFEESLQRNNKGDAALRQLRHMPSFVEIKKRTRSYLVIFFLFSNFVNKTGHEEINILSLRLLLRCHSNGNNNNGIYEMKCKVIYWCWSDCSNCVATHNCMLLQIIIVINSI